MRHPAPRSEFEANAAIHAALPIVGASFHAPAPRRAAKPAASCKGSRRTIGAAALAIVSAFVLVL